MKKFKGSRGLLWLTLAAFVAAIVFGLLLRAIGNATLTAVLSDYILTPIKTMYLSALKLIVVPVVFFSISSCISGLTNVRAYGRIGLKVVLIYLVTSALAVFIGYAISELIQPGAGLVIDLGGVTYEASETKISPLDTLVEIIPSNIIEPFADADMLSIIFVAVLIGIGANTIGNKSDKVKLAEILDMFGRLFQRIASIIIRFIPVATFCAVVLLVVDVGASMLLSLISLILTIIGGMLCMIGVYCILFLAFTRKNPFRLLRKIVPNMVTFAALCSTSAAMPQTLDTCTNELGISPKISSFSIPLGSTINMDGGCLYMVITSLFLARVYGIEVTGGAMMSLLLAAFILSVGAPSVPGIGLICLSVLVTDIGLPIEAVGVVMGIDQILSMCRTLNNGTGDIAMTAIIANSENQLDKEVFDR